MKIGILVTYDIDKGHVPLKNALLKLGYTDTIIGEDNFISNLPNTTLFHSNKTLSEAVNDVKSTAQTIGNIVITHLIAVQFDNWRGTIGEKHAS